ncbi:23S rRNA (pseudouridine(1915)-N(3))-methyltransferase RlmH [Butyrivibrio sp. AE3004]|uniref:23S rRNA (pseudouridine(1915)-N(3))-methyltransferase RlmH n=1 Tax=Butyrivibrio sp. AE3004 TaxID=1506994 RepID=UPI0004943AA3
MAIDILCVGKIKEKYWNEAILEYSKRLSRYCRLNIIEVQDEKTPDNAPEAIEKQIKEKEGERILKNMDSKALKFALAIDGKNFSSPGFADMIEKESVMGISKMQFIIGGSLGLSDEVLKTCDKKLSFSAMTFPHQMMRVILLEQIYRAYRIINGEPYHK